MNNVVLAFIALGAFAVLYLIYYFVRRAAHSGDKDLSNFDTYDLMILFVLFLIALIVFVILFNKNGSSNNQSTSSAYMLPDNSNFTMRSPYTPNSLALSSMSSDQLSSVASSAPLSSVGSSAPPLSSVGSSSISAPVS